MKSRTLSRLPKIGQGIVPSERGATGQAYGRLRSSFERGHRRLSALTPPRALSLPRASATPRPCDGRRAPLVSVSGSPFESCLLRSEHTWLESLACPSGCRNAVNADNAQNPLLLDDNMADEDGIPSMFALFA